jgi:ribosomal 30S subunit maturation factor RimM
VRTPDGKDHKLVPALKTAIKSVDVEKKLMIVNGEWIV